MLSSKPSAAVVRFILNLPGIRSLHERQLLFPVVVIVVVAVVLVDGAIDRTEQVERDASSPRSTTLVPQTPEPTRWLEWPRSSRPRQRLRLRPSLSCLR